MKMSVGGVGVAGVVFSRSFCFGDGGTNGVGDRDLISGIVQRVFSGSTDHVGAATTWFDSRCDGANGVGGRDLINGHVKCVLSGSTDHVVGAAMLLWLLRRAILAESAEGRGRLEQYGAKEQRREGAEESAHGFGLVG